VPPVAADVVRLRAIASVARPRRVRSEFLDRAEALLVIDMETVVGKSN
jgi:hypothetical protein